MEIRVSLELTMSPELRDFVTALVGTRVKGITLNTAEPAREQAPAPAAEQAPVQIAEPEPKKEVAAEAPAAEPAPAPKAEKTEAEWRVAVREAMQKKREQYECENVASSDPEKADLRKKFAKEFRRIAGTLVGGVEAKPSELPVDKIPQFIETVNKLQVTEDGAVEQVAPF